MVLKKIHHLIRYFFIIGLAAFFGYIKNVHRETFLALTGPCLYIAHTIYSFAASQVTLSKSEGMKHFGFLLPVCLVYFSFIGFQLKQLWNERGTVRIIILVVFISFMLYVHFLAYQKLSGYLTAGF